MAAVALLLETRRARIGRWAGAALVVLALHAGGIAYFTLHQSDHDAWDDPAGGVIVDMVALPAPTPVNSVDLAHGPEQQLGGETAEASKQVVQKLEEELPQVEPSPAPNPEVALPKPRPEEKEQLKEEAPETAKQQRPEEQGEQLRTAPPRVEAPPAPSAAKSEGRSPSAAIAEASWMKGMVRELERHKRVPAAARKHRGRWETVVLFKVDRTGKLLDAQIRQSSQVPVLDEEALALLKRVTFPPAPDRLPGETFEYTLPLRFRIN